MEKYIVDILLIAVVVLSAVVAAKKGFFLTLMSIVSAVVALIGSKVLANPIAEFLYSSFVRNPVLTKVQAMLPESLAGNDPQAVLDGLLEQLPSGVVSLADSYGILDGYAINFFHLVFWVHHKVCKLAVVGHNQETFGVFIKSAYGIYSCSYVCN